MNEITPEYIKHSIELKLNTAGFKGQDIDDLIPDFVTERPTVVGLTWYPCADGPQSWTIAIIVSLLVVEFSKEFVKGLSKDVYEWTKGKLVPFFASRPLSVGFFHIQLKDAEIWYKDESGHTDEEKEEKIAAIWRELPRLVLQVDPELSREWQITFDCEQGWIISPYIK